MNTDEMTSWEKLKTEPIISCEKIRAILHNRFSSVPTQMMTPIANPFTALIR